jgi:hypothetical protein
VRDDDDDGWTPDLSARVAAWLAETLGAGSVAGYLGEASGEVVGKLPKKDTKLTPAQAAEKLGRFIPPPWYLIDPARIPFPDSADIWWEGVARMIKEGSLLNDKGKPNYEQAMRYWKNKVKARYGFRPGRTKEQSMMDGIKGKLKSASAAMGKELQKAEPKKSRVGKAAKLIGAQRTQKKRAKELEKAAEKQKRSDASKAGWAKRKGEDA